MTLRYRIRGIFAVLVLAIATTGTSFAQPMGMGYGHHDWPATLDTVRVAGTMLVEETGPHATYYLDVDGDATAEYHLALGPWWYEPESGVQRPSAGQVVTILAARQDDGGMPTLVVFEIDGAVWRSPSDFGRHGWNQEDAWMPAGDTLTVAGRVFVDTTFFYAHYYLDADGDEVPDYHLGFGPPWYEPEGGAVRPSDGADVEVLGVRHVMPGPDMLAVYAIDGAPWRSFGEPTPWAGSWVMQGHGGEAVVYCVNDSASWAGFAAGHMGGGMGGGMGGNRWPDSTFVQFWQVPPDSLPGDAHHQHVAAFYLDVHRPDGSSMMGGAFGPQSGMMRFDQSSHLQMHYFDDDLPDNGVMADDLIVQAWDEAAHAWIDLPGATKEAGSNSFAIESNDLYRYYAVATVATSTAAERPYAVPHMLTLYPGYPNPFNPETTISYDISRKQHVKLAVYDTVGRLIETLVDAIQAPGRYVVHFNASTYASGLYLVRLEGAGTARTQPLVLAK